VYRTFVRIRIQRWGWDDTWAMIAALSALGLFAMMWVLCYEGIDMVAIMVA
jgi:fatty-acid desaturase